MMGPGSLFTSVIPNLLLPKIADEVKEAKAPKVYVANLMTQPGETEGFSLMDHIYWLEKLSGIIPDFIMINETNIPDAVKIRYSKENAVPLLLNKKQEQLLGKKGCKIIKGNFLHLLDGITIRHHSLNLAEALINITREHEDLLWKN